MFARMRSNLTIRPAEAERAWLTVGQLCIRWQLNRKTIYKFIAAEILPAWRVGPRIYRVAVADVLRFERRNRLEPPVKLSPIVPVASVPSVTKLK
jgi:excisionase family DNA binding protein